MENNFDKQLFDFYSQLLEDIDERNLLELILSDSNEEDMINRFISSLGEIENDKV